MRTIKRPFWRLHLLVDFRILFNVIPRHGIRQILRTTGRKSFLQQEDEVFHRAFFSAISSATKKYGRSSKGTFPSRITFKRFVKDLKNSVICPFHLAVNFFKTWGKMQSITALEPLGKDMKTLRTKNSEVEKQSISLGSGIEQVSLCGCSNLRAV